MDYQNLSLEDQKKIVTSMFEKGFRSAQSLIREIDRKIDAKLGNKNLDAIRAHPDLSKLLKLHEELTDTYEFKIPLSIEVDVEVLGDNSRFLAEVSETPLGHQWWDDYLSSLAEEHPDVKAKLDELVIKNKTFEDLCQKVADELDLAYYTVTDSIDIIARNQERETNERED